jgi:hypothetical protein
MLVMGRGRRPVFAWLLLVGSCSVFGGTDELEGDTPDASSNCTAAKSCTGCASCAEYCACAKPFAVEACKSSECPDGGGGASGSAGGDGGGSGGTGNTAGSAGSGQAGASGGGGSSGVGGSAGESCTTCIQTHCKPQYDACATDENCNALMQCASNCSDQACYDACYAQYPIASDALKILNTCIGTYCATECGVAAAD